ncbi:hypothetical protein UY3_05303 [Chelonia mydas]|uniref:Myb/SANT-like DNA-binding domain-containing protein n=1 Tax=Chelonia mydas TaxID=8469 RepID=M7BP56_CHEMY|nr:hypothetical protein UY3_05303 [Chelonia mydas]
MLYWYNSGLVYTTVWGQSKIRNFSYVNSIAKVDILRPTYHSVFTLLRASSPEALEQRSCISADPYACAEGQGLNEIPDFVSPPPQNIKRQLSVPAYGRTTAFCFVESFPTRKGMKDRGHNRDPKQCRVKLKELRQAYQKTREANGRSGSEPQTCRFYDELHAILGGSATTAPAVLFDSFNEDAGNTEAGHFPARLCNYFSRHDCSTLTSNTWTQSAAGCMQELFPFSLHYPQDCKCGLEGLSIHTSRAAQQDKAEKEVDKGRHVPGDPASLWCFGYQAEGLEDDA